MKMQISLDSLILGLILGAILTFCTLKPQVTLKEEEATQAHIHLEKAIIENDKLIDLLTSRKNVEDDRYAMEEARNNYLVESIDYSYSYDSSEYSYGPGFVIDNSFQAPCYVGFRDVISGDLTFRAYKKPHIIDSEWLFYPAPRVTGSPWSPAESINEESLVYKEY